MHGGARISVVDSDPSLRDLLRAGLESKQHKVVSVHVLKRHVRNGEFHFGGRRSHLVDSLDRSRHGYFSDLHSSSPAEPGRNSPALLEGRVVVSHQFVVNTGLRLLTRPSIEPAQMTA
jgi:hypothetical protein